MQGGRTWGLLQLTARSHLAQGDKEHPAEKFTSTVGLQVGAADGGYTGRLKQRKGLLG